jgi:hypothetical protein
MPRFCMGDEPVPADSTRPANFFHRAASFAEKPGGFGSLLHVRVIPGHAGSSPQNARVGVPPAALFEAVAPRTHFVLGAPIAMLERKGRAERVRWRG